MSNICFPSFVLCIHRLDFQQSELIGRLEKNCQLVASSVVVLVVSTTDRLVSLEIVFNGTFPRFFLPSDLKVLISLG